MYADLCIRLIEHFGDNGWMLRDYLLEQCWMSFRVPGADAAQGESSKETGEDHASLAKDTGCNSGGDGVEDAADGREKKRMLGSVRFMGELFNRSLLIPYGIITCAYDLLQYPLNSDSVELAVAFLKVVGPVFDCAEWPHFPEFRSIFWDLRGLTFDQSLAPRVRFLLRDLLELRDHSWLDTRYVTREERPKRLEDVRWEAAAESKPPVAGEMTPALNPVFQFCPLRSDSGGDSQLGCPWMPTAESEGSSVNVTEWSQDGRMADWAAQDCSMLEVPVPLSCH
jgi:hypothetical protein